MTSTQEPVTSYKEHIYTERKTKSIVFKRSLYQATMFSMRLQIMVCHTISNLASTRHTVPYWFNTGPWYGGTLTLSMPNQPLYHVYRYNDKVAPVQDPLPRQHTLFQIILANHVYNKYKTRSISISNNGAPFLLLF